MVTAVAGRVFSWIVWRAAFLNSLCDARRCLSVVAEESADKWRCGVVDWDDAEWIAIKQTAVNERHRDTKTDRQPESCGLCRKLLMWRY